jgi:hypothetical protein
VRRWEVERVRRQNAEGGSRGKGRRAWGIAGRAEGEKVKSAEGARVRRWEGRRASWQAGKLLTKNIPRAPYAYSLLPHTF